MTVTGSCMRVLALLSALGVPASAQVTQRVHVDSAGAEANAYALMPAVSADGRFVAFMSTASNLVPADTNAMSDVFVRDRLLGTTERVSVDSSGVQGNGDSFYSAISGDGRYVAFASFATNLVVGDTVANSDIFLRDRQTGTTSKVTLQAGGAQAGSDSDLPSISSDGRFVAFRSAGASLVAGDENGAIDIFVRDVVAGTNERVSVDSSGVEANSWSDAPVISGDGRFVAFHSNATNLVPGDTNLGIDVFVHDRQAGTTERVSLHSNGAQANGWSQEPGISADGRYVTFWSMDGLVPPSPGYDIFLRDRLTGTTETVSLTNAGVPANGLSMGPSTISDDGRYVAFGSFSNDLGPGPVDSDLDFFVRDRVAGTTEQVSVASSGEQASGDCFPGCPITGDGRFVAFVSIASNLVPGDVNATTDVFLRDRTGGTSFTSLCDPGVAGVIACPCGNPPSGTGRGCNNSASTGGASLAAAGGTYLSSDSLVFTTSGEKPTATSVLLQGTSSPAAGVVYGQGVRCVGGVLKRLFTKTASGGSITAPNFGAGDPTVSARSAAKGNPISAGQSRWYLVFYRDPIVLGGCPSGSTFNATQTGLVSWSP